MKKKHINILLIFLFIFLLVSLIVKYKMKNIKKNELYTIGEVLKISHVNGSRTADFKYFLNGEIYEGSSMNFSDNITKIGSKYFVIVNKKNIKQAYILGDCPYDEARHYVPSDGSHRIPDEVLQKKVDDAFDQIFNSPVGRLLPPY